MHGGGAMKGALLVAGTSSDAGKTVLVAGICRWLARQGVKVAPFKAQNMALNSVVTRSGAEVGRAQAMQAAAADTELEAAMNPVLIKPTGERHSQVIVLGKPYAEVDARSYRTLTDELRPKVIQAFNDLCSRYDVVICEGAGSAAEINLRTSDLTNLWLARAANLATVLVTDIDRGGSFGALFGTLALLEPEDQAHVSGFVFNRFRGDRSILDPGLEALQQRTGRPTLGVIPYDDRIRLDAEDSLGVRGAQGDKYDVVVVKLQYISNFTDLDALAAEPGVQVRFSRSPLDIARADLVVIPGTKATVEDLQRLRADGLDTALRNRRGPILGICGGYQMLGSQITDPIESKQGPVQGLGLLPVTTTFETDKLLLNHGEQGYEIRHGRVHRDGGEEWAGGCQKDNVYGTPRHAALEHDRFRREFLTDLGAADALGSTSFADARARQLDVLAGLVADNLDTPALTRLIENGPPRLPTLETTCSHS
ncbi:MAG: cobyric acid synthase [Solirubrobacterales bacterium]|nr:cobyric acid synthase [Solirubrobacterales bacterium]